MRAIEAAIRAKSDSGATYVFRQHEHRDFRRQREVLAGALFAVGIDDVIMVKRLEKRPGKLILLSDNPAYESIVLSVEDMKSVRIIGRVLWLSRELG